MLSRAPDPRLPYSVANLPRLITALLVVGALIFASRSDSKNSSVSLALRPEAPAAGELGADAPPEFETGLEAELDLDRSALAAVELAPAAREFAASPARLALRVVDESGAGLRAIEVGLRQDGQLVQRGRTRMDGSIELFPEPGIYRLGLQTQALPMGLLPPATFSSLPSEEILEALGPAFEHGGEASEAITIELTRAARLAGRLTSASGEALPERVVRLCALGADRARGQLQARSDAFGEYEFSGLYAGLYELVLAPAMPEECAAVRQVELASGARRRLDLRQEERGGDIRGRLLLADGRPCESYSIRASARAPNSLDPGAGHTLASAITDARGEFRLRGLPDRWLALHSSRAPVRASAFEGGRDAQALHLLDVFPDPRVEVTLDLGELSLPAPGGYGVEGRLQLDPARSARARDYRLELLAGPEGRDGRLQLVIEADGSFAYSLEQVPSALALRVSLAGRVLAQRDLQPEPGRQERIDWTIEP